MKFRIEKNVIKFRLTPQEIQLLKLEYQLSDRIIISEKNKFDFTVKSSTIEKFPSVTFNSNGIIAIIPQSKLEVWFTSEKNGITEKIVNENGDLVTIVVEEDLPPKKIRKDLRKE